MTKKAPFLVILSPVEGPQSLLLAALSLSEWVCQKTFSGHTVPVRRRSEPDTPRSPVFSLYPSYTLP